MKTLYFTATGNCLYAAKKIGGELLSIPQMEKNGIYAINDDVVGIVAPIYAFDVPRPVRSYLEKAVINAKYVFTVMTYGKFPVAALTQMQKILEKKNIRLDYANEIKMVDNFLPLFEMSRELKIKNNAVIDAELDKIVHDIKEQKQYIKKKNAFLRFMSAKLSKAPDSAEKTAVQKGMVSPFIVNEKCNGCGTCRKACPMHNLAGSGKPEYQQSCEFCLACIHLCPQNAIHLKAEKSAARFRNPHITTAEIVQANNQT
jgi:ferredoxin